MSHINGAPIPVNCIKQAFFFLVGGRRKFFAIKFFGVGKKSVGIWLEEVYPKTFFLFCFGGWGKEGW